MRRPILPSLSISAVGLLAIAAAVLHGELWLYESAAGARELAAAPKPARKANAPNTGPRKAPPSETEEAPASGLDYSKFEFARKEPLRVPPATFALCRPPSAVEMEKQKARGPHFAPAVKFFANDKALAELRAGKTSAMPIDATIVKEKWDDEGAKSPIAYAAMIKREAGYDPKHGDWEYVYATLNENGSVERGRLKSCIDCHATAERRDYLFRNWLDAKATPETNATTTPAQKTVEKRAAK